MLSWPDQLFNLKQQQRFPDPDGEGSLIMGKTADSTDVYRRQLLTLFIHWGASHKNSVLNKLVLQRVQSYKQKNTTYNYSLKRNVKRNLFKNWEKHEKGWGWSWCINIKHTDRCQMWATDVVAFLVSGHSWTRECQKCLAWARKNICCSTFQNLLFLSTVFFPLKGALKSLHLKKQQQYTLQFPAHDLWINSSCAN